MHVWQESFKSSNGVTTHSAQEWEMVYDPQPDRSYPDRRNFRTPSGEELFPEKCRRPMGLNMLTERMEEVNLRLGQAGHVAMVLDEAIAGRLCTSSADRTLEPSTTGSYATLLTSHVRTLLRWIRHGAHVRKV